MDLIGWKDQKVIFPLFSKRAGSCSSGLKPKGNPRVRLKVNLFLGGGIIGACMPNIRYKKLVAELKLNGRNNLVHLGQELPRPARKIHLYPVIHF